MTGVLQGFGTIAVMIAAGFLLAHLKILDISVQRALGKVVFWVASPALLVGVVGQADLGQVLSTPFLAQGAAVAVAVLLVAVPARRVFGHDAAGTAVAGSLVGFVNAVNLGLPLAIYALDDATAVVPMVVLQLLFVQPVVLGVLDRQRAGADARPVVTALRTLINPMVLGTLAGLLLALTGWELPLAVGAPLEMIGAMTIPGILIAFGISLRLGPPVGAGGGWPEVAWITAVKLVAMPAVAGAVAWALGLRGAELLAVVVVSALPSAQNVFVIASEYERNVQLARDVVVVTTVLSFPAILGIAAVLG